MLALLGLAASLVPTIGRWIGGASGEAVGKAVGEAATQIFGTSDEKEIEKVIARDPNLAAQFKIQVLEISDRAGQREAERLTKELQDVQNARAMHQTKPDPTVQHLAYSTAFTFLVMNCAVAYGVFALLTKGMDIKNYELAIAAAGVIGNLQGMVNSKAEQVWGFFFGSSVSARNNSQNMTEALTSVAKASTNRT